jgi:hypothetical protein
MKQKAVKAWAPEQRGTTKTSADLARDLGAKQQALERQKAKQADADREYTRCERALAEAGVLADEGDAPAQARLEKLEADLDKRTHMVRNGILKQEVLTQQIADLERELAATVRQEQLNALAALVKKATASGQICDDLMKTTFGPALRVYANDLAAIGGGGLPGCQQITESVAGHLLEILPELYRYTPLRHCLGNVHVHHPFTMWPTYSANRALKGIDPAPAVAESVDVDEASENQQVG